MNTLTYGLNIEPVSLEVGHARAQALGFCTTAQESLVVEYALQRQQRGEEDGAQRTFLGHFGKQYLTEWLMILAAALTQGKRDFEAQKKAASS